MPTPLVCQECGRADRSGEARGWRAYFVGVDEDGFGADVAVFYCPACWQREFGARPE